MTMAAYAVRRTLFYVIVFFVVTMLLFLFLFPAQGTGYGPISAEEFKAQLDAYTAKHGFIPLEYDIFDHGPIPVQYIRWLGDFFTGDWGESLLK